MSGIAASSSSVDTSGGAPPPFTISFDWSGSSVINVSGDSGTCTPAQGVFVILESGGTPPYGNGTGLSFSSNPSGKINFAASSDGTHTTLSWSGFIVNEAQSVTAQFNDQDSAGHSVTKTTSVTIKRTS
jgi:hypothetical protein